MARIRWVFCKEVDVLMIIVASMTVARLGWVLIGNKASCTSEVIDLVGWMAAGLWIVYCIKARKR
jgi:hypothetical protein